MAIFILIALISAAIIYSLYANKKIETRWPRTGRLVVAQGVAAHVIEQGQSDEGIADVLMVHGAASNARELLAAMEGRLGGLRLIAPDRPGLGYSGTPSKSHELGVQAAFVADVLRQTTTAPVVAVGHSWGSGVILRLALDHPELVKALVLIAPASHPWKQKFNIVNLVAGVPLIGDLLVWTMPAILGPNLMHAGVAKGFAPGPVIPANYTAIIGTPLFFRPQSFKANAADMQAGSAQMGLQAPRYKSLTLPVTIVSGQGDVIVFNSIHAAGLARDIAHATSFRVRGAGHMPHWVDPDLVAGVINAYAKDTAMPVSSAQFRADP
jgi:pimeloyl-ACP methyl ester carboxylesterase